MVEGESGDWYARPIFHVANVQSSVDFYVDRAGFAETWRYEERGEPLVAQVEREGCVLILSAQWPDKRGRGTLFISLGDGSVATLDAARAELEARGAPVTEGHWGYRLFVVTDPDGNQLFFNYPAARSDA